MESSSNLTVVSMSAGDSSPSNSEFCVVFQVLCLVNVSDSLALVESCVFSIVKTLDSKKCLLLFLGGLSSSEAGEDSFNVKSTHQIKTKIGSYLTG